MVANVIRELKFISGLFQKLTTYLGVWTERKHSRRLVGKLIRRRTSRGRPEGTGPDEEEDKQTRSREEETAHHHVEPHGLLGFVCGSGKGRSVLRSYQSLHSLVEYRSCD